MCLPKVQAPQVAQPTPQPPPPPLAAPLAPAADSADSAYGTRSAGKARQSLRISMGADAGGRGLNIPG